MQVITKIKFKSGRELELTLEETQELRDALQIQLITFPQPYPYSPYPYYPYPPTYHEDKITCSNV